MPGFLHACEVHLVADGDGSAAGSIGVPTGRYAGTYYEFTGSATGDINVENLRRSVFSKTGASNADAVTELAPSAEHLVHGEIEVSVEHMTAHGSVDVVVFLDY